MRVAVEQDGHVVVHIPGVIGDYATLCGLDGTDEDVGQKTVEVPLRGRARIDCSDCHRIWKQCKAVTYDDFTTLTHLQGT